MSDTLFRILTEGLCAAFVGPAFAMLFLVPKRYLLIIATSSALARIIRQSLYLTDTLEIVSATFIAAAAISAIFIYIAPKLQVPRPVFTVTSCISLVPGLDTYNALLALISIIHGKHSDLMAEIIVLLFNHGMRAFAVLLAICLGIAIVPLFFYRYRYHHL